MGFFSNMLGGKSKYPDIPADNPLASQVEQIKGPLQTLMEKVKDPLEIVPADGYTYIFIGKPPKRFGVAWIKEGELNNLQLIAKEKGIGAAEMQDISEKLGSAYEQCNDAPRYTANIADREVIVTPSTDLTKKVDQIIGEAIN